MLRPPRSRAPISRPAACKARCLGLYCRARSPIATRRRNAAPFLHGRNDTAMKAIIMDRHGGLDVLRYGDLPDPVAEAGQVVVDIHAASVNGADSKVRQGGSYTTVS